MEIVIINGHLQKTNTNQEQGRLDRFDFIKGRLFISHIDFLCITKPMRRKIYTWATLWMWLIAILLHQQINGRSDFIDRTNYQVQQETCCVTECMAFDAGLLLELKSSQALSSSFVTVCVAGLFNAWWRVSPKQQHHADVFYQGVHGSGLYRELRDKVIWKKHQSFSTWDLGIVSARNTARYIRVGIEIDIALESNQEMCLYECLVSFLFFKSSVWYFKDTSRWLLYIVSASF